MWKPKESDLVWAGRFLQMMKEGSTWAIPATGTVYRISHEEKSLTRIAQLDLDIDAWSVEKGNEIHERNRAVFGHFGYELKDALQEEKK